MASVSAARVNRVCRSEKSGGQDRAAQEARRGNPRTSRCRSTSAKWKQNHPPATSKSRTRPGRNLGRNHVRPPEYSSPAAAERSSTRSDTSVRHFQLADGNACVPDQLIGGSRRGHPASIVRWHDRLRLLLRYGSEHGLELGNNGLIEVLAHHHGIV